MNSKVDRSPSGDRDKATPSSLGLEQTDRYPSRGKLTSQLTKRKDPVIYAPAHEDPPIDKSLIEQYERQGFMIIEDVFSEQEVTAFRQEMSQLSQNETVKRSNEIITEPGSGDIRSIFKIHETSALFKKLSEDRRLVDIAQYLLNDQVYIHQSRLNYKPGFRGKEFYWHSDFETWHVEDGMPSMRALSMSITLTENYPENGPLMLIPGSHQHYVVCEGDTPDNHFESSLKKQECGTPSDERLSELAEEGGIRAPIGKPGSVIIFECNTLHGSNSNITPFPRSNAFLVYNALSNQVGRPFCDQQPRPEYICTRQNIKPIKTT
jgi:ectoine hydroxylase